jgi:hypothetical protein
MVTRKYSKEFEGLPSVQHDQYTKILLSSLPNQIYRYTSLEVSEVQQGWHIRNSPKFLSLTSFPTATSVAAPSYVWSLHKTDTEPARSGHILIDGEQLPFLLSLKHFLEMLPTKEASLARG